MKQAERNQLIDALLEGEITEADFLRLEAELSVDPDARKAYYDRVELSLSLEAEAKARPAIRTSKTDRARWRIPSLVALAATLVIVSAGGALLFWRHGAINPQQPAVENPVAARKEPEADGFGVLVTQLGATWDRKTGALLNGALLPARPIHLEAGIAQIELFSGVTLVIEGDAEFELVSAMELRLARGKLRAQVPIPAHGFRVRTDGGDVVDLGTEFAMNVSPEQSEVHVLKGEVEWNPTANATRRMVQGEALRLKPDADPKPIPADAAEFVGLAELSKRREAARQKRHEEWQAASERLRHDPRLLACYRPAAADAWNRQIPNLASGAPAQVSPGTIVGAMRVEDRWGVADGAVDFSPTGSRVRVTVPGEHRSITLMCWVKINSLDRWYNSLFLTDGHAVGAPHWQIMDDGRLFFSVKKSDTAGKAGQRDKFDFYSPPFWNASLSGQWLMLATTYDVDNRVVTHFLNGKPLGREAVPDGYLVEKVVIGNASIGNWSNPAYRKDASFAVRNLNGSMDEFLLFDAALTADEMASIYEQGRP